MSRIAAQNAKSVISSIVRDAGRQSIYEEFSNRVGDLVTGTVLQGTPDFTIVKIRDGVEAELPHYDVKRNPASATSVRPASTTVTTSASRRSSSTCATPAPTRPARAASRLARPSWSRAPIRT